MINNACTTAEMCMNLFGSMEFSIKIDTIKSGWSIVYIERLQVIISKINTASSNGCHYGPIFFKPEKNLEFFRLKNWPIDGYPGKLE